MVSLKNFLKVDSGAQGYDRALRLIVQGIGLHAVTADENYRSLFAWELDKLYKGLEDPPTPQALLEVAAAINKATEKYNQETTTALRAESTELQKIVTLLAGTIKSISHGSERSVSRLQTIEKQIERACCSSDIRVLKNSLEECLTDLREECARQQRDVGKNLEDLQVSLGNVPVQIQKVDKYSETDSVTGLAGRDEAQQKLAQLTAAGHSFHVALFLVERLQLINERYGPDAGDDVLLLISQNLAQALTDHDCLYRWGLAAFVAVFESATCRDELRDVIASLLPSKMQMTIKVEGRPVMLPVSCRWEIWPAGNGVNGPDLTQTIEAFFLA